MSSHVSRVFVGGVGGLNLVDRVIKIGLTLAGNLIMTHQSLKNYKLLVF